MADNLSKKYRPKKIADLIGQDAATIALSNALQSGRVPPAYLLHGTKGCGKTTTARLLAMTLNCENKQGIDPCGVCLSCKMILEDRSEFLLEIDAPQIGKREKTDNAVKHLSEIMQSINVWVEEGHYLVVVIDECHALGGRAWDTALKTIEEPPPRVMFVFCTTEYASVIPTIASRCIKIGYLQVPEDIIFQSLKKIVTAENVPHEDEALKKIASYAEGSIRDAQNGLEMFIGSGDIKAHDVQQIYPTLAPRDLVTYFNFIFAKDTRGAGQIGFQWMRSGLTPDKIIVELLRHITNMFMDWTIKDPALKTLLSNQKNKIGEAVLEQWIYKLEEKLRLIKAFPMSYTIIMSTLTIMLMGVMSQETTVKKKTTKKGKASTPPTPPVNNTEEAPTPDMPVSTTKPPAVPPVPSDSLSLTKVEKFKITGKFINVEMDNSMKRITVKNEKGVLLDIVTTPTMVKNTYYILDTDLDKAMENYPTHMNELVKQKI